MSRKLSHRFLSLLFAGCLLTSISFAQDQTEDLPGKTYGSLNTSEIYLKQSHKIMPTQNDSITYLYNKFNTALKNNLNEELEEYAEQLIPLLFSANRLDLLSKIYYELGNRKRWQGKYEESLQYHQKALLLAEELKEYQRVAKILTGISFTYHDFEDYANGVKNGKRAAEVLEQYQINNLDNIIRSNNAIAINFDDWQQPDSALTYHFKNLEYLRIHTDSTQYGFVYNNIGNTLIKEKRFLEAKSYLDKALELNLNLHTETASKTYSLATTYNNLAVISYELKNNQQAKNYFDKALEYSLASNNIEKIRDVSQDQIRFYKKLGDYQTAFALQEKFYELRDSVYSLERSKAMAELEVKYETERKERQILEQNQLLIEKDNRAKKKNLIIYGSLLLSGIIGVIGILLYKQQNLVNKQLQKEVELQIAISQIAAQTQLQEERNRISRDLHDNIGAKLTFIISSLDNLKYGFTDLPKKLRDKLEHIGQFAAATIGELRDTIWVMNKAAINFEDFHIRIANFIDKARQTGIEVDFEFKISGDVNQSHFFPAERAMNIYRIIQEAVHNALKHAKAKKISIEVSRQAEEYQIEISDDGKGFLLQEIPRQSGLKNMQKRADELNAKLEIISKPGSGTRITLR